MSQSQLVLEEKSAIVTGAASGMGQAVAECFAVAGARVVFADLNGSGATDAANRARTCGAEAIGIALDVTQAEAVIGCVQSTVQRFGSVDILFNAAGIHAHRSLLEVTPESFNRLWSVNVLGLLLMVQACSRQMIAQGRGGKIINVASIAGRQGRAQQLEYNASKAAVISLTQSAALELIEHRICVNAIAPGAIVTGMWHEIQREVGEKVLKMDYAAFDQRTEGMIPAKRLGTPVDVVGAALFLASSASDYIVGQTINIDGGMILN